jgi:hypothetical protein
MLRKGECRMSIRRAACLAVLAVASVLMFTADEAACITIRPAAFDRVLADVPAEVMAGVEFEVRITFVDRYGNPMSDTWKPESSLALNVSQPASVQPPILTPENYVPGFTFSVQTEKMGELTLSLRDSKSRVLDQWNLKIKSGRPVTLLVDLPARAEVGETVTMSIQAVDAHGNVAFGYVPRAQSIALEDSAVSVAGEFKSKAGGIYELPVIFKGYGQRSVTIRDRKRGLTGSSGRIDVAPAPLGSFDLKASTRQSVAGEEFALTIRALDRYGNLVTDYSSRYKGIRLYAKTADIAPDLITPSSFSEGVARVELVMKSAGDHTIKVSELQSNISGDFSVRIVPAAVKTLQVQTPDAATAGEPFEITITSRDRFGNLTPSLPAGTRVRLTSTGTGAIKPATVNVDEFINGKAVVNVSYERAESFEILAELEGAADASVTPMHVDEKEKERILALKAREEAMRARRESRLMEKRVSQKLSPSTKPHSSTDVKTEEKTPIPSKSAVPGPVTPAPVKPEPAAKKTEPAKTPESPAPVAASKTLLRPGVLDSITVVEEAGKALVTFSTNGMTDYNVTTSAKLSRKWIDIEFPDMAVDLPDKISGGEKIVGEVYVEPSMDGGPGVRVSVEILPTRIGYDVYQEGQSLVLKVSSQ